MLEVAERAAAHPARSAGILRVRMVAAAFVVAGAANSLWLFAPAWGIVASIILINSNSYGLLR